MNDFLFKYKPTSNGVRHRVNVKNIELTKQLNKNKKKNKNLIISLKRSYGIDNKGRRRFLQFSGKHKIKYRKVNFKRDFYDKIGVVKSIDYDPNRSANIALVEYILDNNVKHYEYILSVDNLKKGDQVISYNKLIPKVSLGNSMRLENIPIGTSISNVQTRPNSFNTIGRSAGCFLVVLLKKGDYVKIKMPSKEIRLLHKNCYATIGKIGNLNHSLRKKGKAGVNYYCGKRPRVRGLAKNACDHKHGGGKNSSSIGNLKGPMSAKGLKTLGYKTRRNKRTSKFILKRIN